MKKKIITSLFILFTCFSVGAVLSIWYIHDSTERLSRVIELHQVENIRRSLVLSLQTVQADLYSVKTGFARELDSIIGNVRILDKASENCTTCHHSPELTKNLQEMQKLVHQYQDYISYYITGSANENRLEKLKLQAVEQGNNLLGITQNMSHRSSRHLETLSKNAMDNVNKVKTIMFITLLGTLLIAIFVAVKLINFVTYPISNLLEATRKISSGDFGFTTSYRDSTEFGELAEHFNIMSITVKEEYEKTQKEIQRSMLAEEALSESKKRYELAARGANDGLWDWNIATNKTYFSPRWKSMLGFEEDEVKDAPEEWFNRVHPDDRKRVESEIAGSLETPTAHFICEYRMLHKDGTYRWMLSRGLAVKNESGLVARMAGSQTEITERKIAEEQLIHDAFHDTLTGLPNRVLFMDRLKHADRRAARHKDYIFSVLFVDLDRFKVVNDSLGHAIGDELLVAVSQRLEECLRPGETVARLGGDEFAILLEDIKSNNDMEHIINRIQNKLEMPFNLSGNEVFTSASIGISLSVAGYVNPEHMLRDADIAMYHAKLNGRARYEIFDERMHAHVVARLQLETDLRHAIENHQFHLNYQPIMLMDTGKIKGFEALVRWNHPNRGLIMPAEFISIAEDTGIILALGKWVLEEACKQLSIWQKQVACDISMGVNLSIKQFTPHLVSTVKDAILHAGIKPESLILEITESMIMENAESASKLLAELKLLNVKLHIDDFGTGYSSLSYLHQFPLDALKIDRSFIAKIGIDSDEKLEIVKAIAALANNLNLDVIAEGVETVEQLAHLRHLNCKNMQGYLFSRPLDVESAGKFLRQSLNGDGESARKQKEG
ncbi:MAG: EAL domain-containing protein [Nitrospirae bacterium]|nr:EAL domain-containing protein [Nitrospirota bacterium]